VQEQWPRPSPKARQVPQDPMMRNKFLASLDCGVPVTTYLNRNYEKNRNRSSSSGCQKTSNFNTFPGRPYTEPLGLKPQQRKRSLSFTQSLRNQCPSTSHEHPSLFGAVDERVKALSDRNLKQLPELRKAGINADEPTLDKYAKFKQRRELTKELNCPHDTTKDAQSLFDYYAKNGVLDRKRFGKIVEQMMKTAEQELTEEGMKVKIEVSWREVDRNYTGQIDFDEFAIWYSSSGFKQDLLLSPTKIRTRDFAKNYGLSIAEVDSAHSMFERFDEDGSGKIEFDEFKKLLYKLMQVPRGVELPATRLQHFWKEIDLNRDGSVCFAEFLQWYTKYFDMSGNSNLCPIEQFYLSVRPQFGRTTGA